MREEASLEGAWASRLRSSDSSQGWELGLCCGLERKHRSELLCGWFTHLDHWSECVCLVWWVVSICYAFCPWPCSVVPETRLLLPLSTPFLWLASAHLVTMSVLISEICGRFFFSKSCFYPSFWQLKSSLCYFSAQPLQSPPQLVSLYHCLELPARHAQDSPLVHLTFFLPELWDLCLSRFSISCHWWVGSGNVPNQSPAKLGFKALDSQARGYI